MARTTTVVLSCALLTTLASAEPSKEELQVARTLFGQALAEEKLEHWDVALTKLESVQAIKASPSVRYHIALCEEKLGRLAAALSDYEAARVAARNDGNKEVLSIVDEPIARLSVDVPHVTLMLAAPPPPGAKIEIDQRNLTVIGFNVPIPLDPGAHEILVSAPNRASFKHSLILQPKGDVGVTVALSPLVVAAPLAPPREAPSKTYPERPYAIAATAGALVFAGAGIGMILGAGVVKSGNVDGEGCSASTSADACDGKKTSIRVLDWGGGAALVGAVGLAAVSVVLWTRPGRSTTSSLAPHTRLAFGPGRVGLEGTFE